MRTLITPCLIAQSIILCLQPDSIAGQLLAPVTISAARLEFNRNELPFSVAVLENFQLQRLQQQISVFEALSTVPGVFVQNPDNFAQDLRISIRGFGARSAFGIRGIRIITDGIPESTPDGQADVDNIDAGALQRMEILKGGSSALYGNASGGVIYLKTEEPPDAPFAEAQVVQGSFGFQRYQTKAGFKRGKVGGFLSMGYNQQTGYRQQQAMRQFILNNKWRVDFSAKTTLTLLLNYANSPQAEDPGGLTAEQVSADRHQARPQNILYNAGEKLQQGRAGVVIAHRLTDNQHLTVRGFLTARQFSNRLAFQTGGTVEIDRLFGGGGVQYSLNHSVFQRPYRTQIGVDLDGVRDHRQRFQNNEGVKGEQTLDQNESFRSTGVYWLNEYKFANRWLLTAGARLDRVTLEASDRFLSDGNQSGRIPVTRFSPSAGLMFKIKPLVNVYANTSSNFETPTLNELSANPNNTGGFNPELKPQKSWSNEIGIKATVFRKLHVETALFFIALKNEFVPYQLGDFPGRTFYRNAGKSQRKGLEFALDWAASSASTFSMNYTWSDFRYTGFMSNNQDFSNHFIPGIPVHQGFGAWRWSSKMGLNAVIQLRYVGSFYTNDANTIENGAYTLLSTKLGYHYQFSNWTLEPFAGANNLFNARYNANVLINGAGDRFFEPGAGVYFYGGLKIRFGGT